MGTCLNKRFRYYHCSRTYKTSVRPATCKARYIRANEIEDIVWSKVREVIEHGRNGLLGDFFDVEGLAAQAINVLRDPKQYRNLGREGRALIERKYSLETTVPLIQSLFRRVADPTAASRAANS